MAPQYKTMAPPSLQRLLALEKNFSDLDQQIREVVSVLGLPSTWDLPKSSTSSTENLHYHARAEWVLRWILEKLRTEGIAGSQARRNIRAWKLLDYLVPIIPTSNAGVLLRTGGYATTLDKTLDENYGDEVLTRATTVDGSWECSESSATIEEQPPSSRKRKRHGEVEAPAKKRTLGGGASKDLFDAIARSIETIVAKSQSPQETEGKIVADHMKMVLRVDNAKAARLSKFWLNAIISMILDADARLSVLKASDDCMGLTPIIRIWELRTMDAKDDGGASVDSFSEYCLVPATILLGLMKEDKNFKGLDGDSSNTRTAVTILLEQLFARHLFIPCRADFFTKLAATEVAEAMIEESEELALPKAAKLQLCLDGLRTRLTQAASLRRMSEPMPQFSELLFRTVPNLLGIAIRCSPRLTPRTRTSEKPWTQAVLVTLLECAGCALVKRAFENSEDTVRSVEDMLKLLLDWKLSVDSSVTRAILTFNSGVPELPGREHRTIWWGLVAKLVTLDPDIFIPEAVEDFSATAKSSDLSRLVFRQLSKFPSSLLDSSNEVQFDKVWNVSHNLSGLISASESGIPTARFVLQESVIVPIMKTFARNRDLLGFLTRWQDQLRTWEGSVASPSLWQSQDLVFALASMLESSLTLTQINKLFQAHHNTTSSLLNTLKSIHDANSPTLTDEFFKGSNASTIMARILVECIQLDETVAGLRDTLQTLQSNLIELSTFKVYRIHADMTETWTALSLLFSLLWPLDSQTYLGDPNEILSSKTVQLASEAIAPGGVNIWNVLPELDIRSRTAAFAFLVTILHHVEYVPASREVVSGYLDKALRSLLPATIFEDEGQTYKNGLAFVEPVSKIDSNSASEFLRCLERLVIGSPALLLYLKPDVRSPLFSLMFELAAVDRSARGFKDLMVASLDPIFSSNDGSLKDDLLSAMFSGLDKSYYNVAGADSVDFATSLYAQIPVKVIPRKRREAILNLAEGHLVEGELSKEQALFHLAILARLMELPNATAQLSSSPDELIKLAAALSTEDYEVDSKGVEIYRFIVQSILGHMLLDKNQKHGEEYLQDLANMLCRFTCKSIALEKIRFADGLLSAVRADRLTDDGGIYAQFARTCVGYCARNLKVSRKSGLLDLVEPKESWSDIDIETLLQVLSQVPADVAEREVNSFKLIKSIVRECISQYLVSSSVQIPADLSSVDYWVSMHKMVARLQICNSVGELIRFSISVLNLDLTAQQTQNVVNLVRDGSTTFGTPAILETLPLLLPRQEKPDAGSLPVLGILIPTLTNSDDAEQKAQLQAVLGNLSAHIASSNDLACFNALLDCIDTILRSKHFMVSQFGMETFIGALVTIASPKGPVLPSSQSSAIFVRLCESIHIILSLHRSRLGGRFHLLMPVLQSFLACLYIPNVTRRGTSTAHFPPWISPSTAPLTSAAAVAFTRLLTTISSPTVSAVSGLHKGRKGHSELVDATKQGRQYAGQYLPTFIAAFCKNLLSGRLVPEVRDRLMPGVWSALDCTDKEGLRAMSAAMDASTRAVWKGLYVEWKKNRRGQTVG